MTSGNDNKQEPSLPQQVNELASQMAEARQQMIKTANILGNLTAEVKAIGRHQHQQRRGLMLNSAVAYALFVVLIASAAYFLYHSQLERLDLEKDTLAREHAALVNQNDEARKAAKERRQAEAQALAFYRLMQANETQKALERYPRLAALPLSPVEAALFQEWVGKLRNRLATAAFSAGMQAINEQHWKRAVTELQSAHSHLPQAPHEPALRYYLGIALMKLGSYKEAAVELEAALNLDAEKSVSRETRFHLGTIYEQLAQRDQAIQAYEAYLRHNPSTSYAQAAKRRISALK